MTDITPEEAMGHWIKVEVYMAATGDNLNTIHKRIASGAWKLGIHYSSPEGEASWVNTKEVVAWISSGSPVPPAAGVGGEPPLPEWNEPISETEEEPIPTYTIYVPELLQDDETAPPLYANLSGMDLPSYTPQGTAVLGAHTAAVRNSLQFNSKCECDLWIKDNPGEHIYMCSTHTLTYL